MSLTETGHEVVNLNEIRCCRTAPKRASVAAILRESRDISPQSLVALRSAWNELSEELIEDRARELRKKIKLVSSEPTDLRAIS